MSNFVASQRPRWYLGSQVHPARELFMETPLEDWETDKIILKVLTLFARELTCILSKFSVLAEKKKHELYRIS